jgi:hypothetical protein
MSNLQFFRGVSLVDITPTGVIRGVNDDALERNQQRNWETVLQCIGLRTQPQYIQEPIVATLTDVENAKFGDFYTGEQKVWTWTWGVEGEGIRPS